MINIFNLLDNHKLNQSGRNIVYAEIVKDKQSFHCSNIIENIVQNENGDLVLMAKNMIGLVAIDPMIFDEVYEIVSKALANKKDLKIFILDSDFRQQLVNETEEINSYESSDGNVTEKEYKTFCFISVLI
jgi:hypothetical protein